MANCKDLETILTDVESSDINSLELCDEISVVCLLLEKDLPPLEVLKSIAKMNFAPNLSIALRILLTLPLVLHPGNVVFPNYLYILKINKNFLRTTTSQTRLWDLPILRIENELSNSLDVSELIRDFSELKVRKKHSSELYSC
ncbi:hypothetical protein AVEN_19347-1 [Araneus ventricosus]|uniref:HAT C-terminal dimerisation domain-containing protein n=1 Tax=Araneus ventricosus TaxID=182803 RepID=A0A4Y2HGY5_ARAVE|nr:hypothetical protein AVEN_19347-1 [Araneus ventricosus]